MLWRGWKGRIGEGEDVGVMDVMDRMDGWWAPEL